MAENSGEARNALERLRAYRSALTTQQIKTLRGQILAGDVAGAEKGLRNILNRRKR